MTTVTKTQASQEASPAAAEYAVPTSAHDPGSATAKALYANVSMTDLYVVAAIVFQNPRHESALLGYLASTYGNDYLMQVYDQLDWMGQQWQRDPDSARHVRNRGAMATAGGGDASGSAPEPKAQLPYDQSGGWNALKINARLGQADKIAATDSDGARCAFAVALAGQVFLGPNATAAWLVGFLNANAPRTPSPRQTAAALTIREVATAVGAGTATYGDLSWAQEALHAHQRAAEDQGTSDSMDVVVPDLETYTSLGDKKLQSAEAIVQEASTLKEGERLMLVLKIVVNRGQSEDEATEADLAAHQVMITRHGGDLLWYDPETDIHLVKANERSIGTYFDPFKSLSTVVVVQGKVTPTKPKA